MNQLKVEERANNLKGITGEFAMMNLLDNFNIPYLFIEQSQGTFSLNLSSANAQRPDFVLLSSDLDKPKHACVFLDVKNYAEYEHGSYIKISVASVEKLVKLETLFDVPSYIAFYSSSGLFYFFRSGQIKNKLTPEVGSYKIEFTKNPAFNEQAPLSASKMFSEHSSFTAHSGCQANLGMNSHLNILDELFN